MIKERVVNGQDQTGAGGEISYAKWLNKFVPQRKFDLKVAFSNDKKLLEEVEDPEDRAYLRVIGETRTARMAGDSSLIALFPTDHSRAKRLSKQVKVVQESTPIEDWQKLHISISALAVDGDYNVAEARGQAN